MLPRNSHIGKNHFEREYYKKRIHEVDYDPTIDESFEFQNSDDGEKDYSTTAGGKLQREGLNKKIGNFVRDNLFGMIVSCIGALAIIVFSLFAISLNREVGVQESKISGIETTLTRNGDLILEQNETIFDIRLLIANLSKDFEYFRRDLDKK